MTANRMLDLLKKFCEEVTGHMKLSVALQKDDEDIIQRAPEVHCMRLPQSNSVRKYVPYVIIQYISGKDVQPQGMSSTTTAVIRFIVCVYHENEECGAKELNNVMDCIKIALLQDGIVGNALLLRKDAGVETFVYPDDTAPYYGGEIVATFEIAAIERDFRKEVFYG